MTQHASTRAHHKPTHKPARHEPQAHHTVIAGDAATMLRALPIEPASVRSRQVFSGAGASLVRLSLDAGAVLAEHTATSPILLQVLHGHAGLDVDGQRVDLPEGTIVHVDAAVPHAVEALTETHLLLTMLETPTASVVVARRPRAVDAPRLLDARSITPSSGANTSLPSGPRPPASIVLSSSGRDADAVELVTARHAELSGSLAAHTAGLLDAAAGANEARISAAKATLLDWCRGALSELLDAEQRVLDPAVRLVDDLLAGRLGTERDNIATAIDRLADRRATLEIATAAVALRVQISHHLRTFADQALPLLAGTSRLALGELWAEIDTRPAAHQHGAGHQHSAVAQCECGIVDGPEFPELDVRTVPHAIRHATVFGALDAIDDGAGLVLVAPHDPLPLLAQIEQRSPGRFTVNYLDRGPETWRLMLSAA